MPTPEYERALAVGSMGILERYVPGLRPGLQGSARGRAGGLRSRTGGVTEAEKATLRGLTAEGVGRLTKDELTSLHRRCHKLAGKAKGTDMRINVNLKQGLGRMGGNALGPGDECVCPECGAKVKHETGEPCYDVKCPKCGTKMARPTTEQA